MILALHEMTPERAKRQETIDIFLSIRGLTVFKRGCLGAELLSGIEDSKLLYIEKWRSKQEFSAHLQSTEYLKVLNALEFSAAPPLISFYGVVEEDGMGLIEEIRHRSGNGV